MATPIELALALSFVVLALVLLAIHIRQRWFESRTLEAFQIMESKINQKEREKSV